MSEKARDLHQELTEAMTLAMRDLLGSGFVRSYYASAASEFIGIAERHAEEIATRRLDGAA